MWPFKRKEPGTRFNVGDRVRVINRNNEYYLEETVITAVLRNIWAHDTNGNSDALLRECYETELPPTRAPFTRFVFLGSELQRILDGDDRLATTWDSLKGIYDPRKQKVDTDG